MALTAPAESPLPATVTLTLTPQQAEKVLELVLKGVIEKDPQLLTQCIPQFVDLLTRG